MKYYEEITDSGNDSGKNDKGDKSDESKDAKDNKDSDSSKDADSKDCGDSEEEKEEESESSKGDGLCVGVWGGICQFPWSDRTLGSFQSCKDAKERLNPSEPWCKTTEGRFDKCAYDEKDPDCIF